jgi:hypothetical protein
MYAVVLKYPFTGTKGVSPEHYLSSTKLYSRHYALEEVVFWHLPNPDLYIGQPDGET